MARCDYLKWEGGLWSDRYTCALCNKELSEHEVKFKCKEDPKKCEIYKYKR